VSNIGVGPNYTVDNVVDARAEFNARALIAQVEQRLKKYGDLEKYDVYCEWFEDTGPNFDYEIWLRDRTDDSRIGPFDVKNLARNDNI